MFGSQAEATSVTVRLPGGTHMKVQVAADSAHGGVASVERHVPRVQQALGVLQGGGSIASVAGIGTVILSSDRTAMVYERHLEMWL
jgi:hypothetical protein